MPRSTIRHQLDAIDRRIIACQRCPRLRDHCRKVASTPRPAYREERYWARPVPNFADRRSPGPRLMVLGLAPAAHGANRTGRMFTGDRSGDFLFRAMHDAGFANQPHAAHRDDGLALRDAIITAAAHCAPPANKPTADELANCRPFLDDTFDALLPRLKVIVCLGRIGHDAALRLYQRRGFVQRLAQHRFAHAAHHHFPNAPDLIDSYHPSQQNTFTGRLTPAMLRDVFQQARKTIETR